MKRSLGDKLVGRIKQWYDSLVEVYDELYGEEQMTKHRLLVQALGVPKGRVLDAGAGSMLLERVLLGEKHHEDAWLVALDVSVILPRAYEKLKAYFSVDAVLGDLLHAPFRPSAFDRVYCVTVLGGYGSEARKAALLLLELLREQGLMILSVHEKTISANELEALQELCERVLRLHVDIACVVERSG